MTGFATAMGECFGCKHLFTFSPTKVPSVLVDGVRQPVCESCVERVNPIRIANNLEPIVPLPGAYEADEVGEL